MSFSIAESRDRASAQRPQPVSVTDDAAQAGYVVKLVLENREKTEDAIRKALGRKDRPGLLKIAKELGVGTSTVQRIAAQSVR